MSQAPVNLLERPKNTRAKHSRSRFGCGTCRARRIRCDQSRPVCMRCSSTGRICDGYVHVLPGHATWRPTLAIAPKRPAGGCCIDSSEVSALRHFQQSTSRKLAGDFKDDFWGSLVLQACVTEPCIRHMTVALACLHGYVQPLPEMNTMTHDLKRLSLSHYIAGICHLNTLIAQKGWSRLDIVLMCSALCIFFEWRQHNHSAALMHLQSSLKVLKQWLEPSPSISKTVGIMKKTSPEGQLIRQTLIPILAKMVVQTVSLLDAQTVAIALPKINLADQLRPAGGFNTLAEAKESLLSLLAQEYMPSSVTPPGSLCVSPLPLFVIQQRQWSERLDFLLQQRSTSLPENAAAVLSLTAWRKSTYLMAMRKTAPSDAIYKQLGDQFDEIFKVCATLFDMQEPCVFSADGSILLVLYYVAFHTPKPALRREILKVFETSKRCEGIWDSELAAVLARRVLEADKKRLQEDPVLKQFFWNLPMRENAELPMGKMSSRPH